jgi:ribonuclease VapC
VALMVIDTSAVIACLLDEPERVSFVECIEADPVRLISMVGFVEASLVILSRRGAEGLADLAAFLDRAEIDRVAVDARQADEAVEAFRRFGRGRHPAALNIGDCFAYALARTTGEPLLFKGGDFAQTDVAATTRA